MRKSYDLKLIYDYIWGNDIDGNLVLELENDPEFMFQVVKRTRDKKMYELCSDAVKGDYIFVRDVIDLFKDDLEFSEKVARGYLNSRDFDDDDLSVIELNIIMSNLFGKTVNDFTLRTAAFYETERVRMKVSMGYIDDSQIKSMSREGFYLVRCEYDTSDIIVDYIAKRMIGEALYGDRYNNLEYLIHEKFRSIEDFQDYGKINFLHDQVREFDFYLSDYSFNPVRVDAFDVFYGSALKDIERIEADWDSYMNRVNAWRVDAFDYEMNQYMMNHGVISRLSYNDLVSYVANKIGVVSAFEQFEPEFVFQADPDVYDVLGIDDVLCINKGIQLAKELFHVDVIDEYSDDYCDEGANKIPEDSKKESSRVVRFQLADAKSSGTRK